ncbi:CBS domain-containing protein [Streptomyces oryzae]|uniref:CBS domain-containing protein n=1 Tax=Streptomyces oryzae TaxID=1434886 RepID=A0ABS3X5A1_9ACTN|nr:CBS domain-containing protein [Streptomyces oryzae]MBO8190509.1 CBS domain-containing protein [Streptomyces oryzae]
MTHRTVRDLMTRPAVCVHTGTGLKDTARLLAEHDISALPVVDDRDRPVGVVSEGDLLQAQAEPAEPAADLLPVGHKRHRRQAGARAEAGTAGGLMTSPAVVAGPEWTVVEAARAMQTQGVKRLPVVNETGQVIGVLSRADLLRVFLRKDSAIEDEIVDEVLGHALGLSRGQVTAAVADGVVKLRGEIGSEDSLPLIEVLCRRVDGVVDVQLDLEVAGRPRKAA